jgi:serine/threonine protein kinase
MFSIIPFPALPDCCCRPENLLLTNVKEGEKTTMRVQIADFGFATMMERVGGMPSRLLQSVVGTPAYLAPEIVDHRIHQYVGSQGTGYGKSADMWSLGVILYVCLGGVFPFESQEPILDQVLRGEFFFPDEYFGDVSDDAVDFVCKLLVVDPSKRLTCQGCLRDRWLASN